jgi:homoserine O-acetyltransferase
MKTKLLLLVLALFTSTSAANYPAPREADYLIKDFAFGSGERLPELRIHYRTLGEPQRDAQGHVTNAILILHSTGGSSEQFLNDRFAAVLFNPGQLLDSTKYFIIIPDSIGHGKSTKPSDGLHARFPHYRYADMVRAQHQLVTDHLKIDHLRLVIGMSMGCMHAWLWAEDYPSMMDGTIPLAGLPAEIAGRNRMWRKTAHDAITLDPEYAGGDYKKQPRGVATAYQILALVGSNPVERQRQYPTGPTAEKYMDEVAQLPRHEDGNDLAYALDSSLGYDPRPRLSSIQAPLLAINFADDLINPPELGILESAIKEVPNGRAILVPAGPNTHGHGTHTYAEVWKEHLQQFLQQTSPPGVFHVSKTAADTSPWVYQPDPPYTESARKARVEGTVVLWASIAVDGTVKDLGVQRSLRPDLDESAVNTVKTWRFKPAMKNGMAVPVRINIEVNFKLYDDPQPKSH